MVRFAVLDLETANARRHSICQIGVVVFESDREIACNVSLIDPRETFDPFNIRLHGIGPDRVAGLPTFAQVHDQLARSFHGQIVVSHTPFDRNALDQACDLAALPRFDCRWLDSARVVRTAWPQYAKRGFGLPNVARDLGIVFDHHDALEDARAAGQILVHAMKDTGKTLDDLICEQVRPRPPANVDRAALRRAGDGDGPLLGETVVFTGDFGHSSKAELAALANLAGADTEPNVTRRTTMLVVGTQDWTVVGPTGKSEKHRRAEQMISNGASILIVSEDDFRQLVRGPGGLEDLPV